MKIAYFGGVSGGGSAALPTEEKFVTPGAEAQEVTPTPGKTLSKVTVAGDADLTAGNIKKDVVIFGVTGTVESGDPVLAERYTYEDITLSLDDAAELTVAVSTAVTDIT